MADSKVVWRVLLLAMAMAAAALFAGPSPAEAGALFICGKDASNLARKCENYVIKDVGSQGVRKLREVVNPSAACCGEVQKFDMACVCRNLPPSLKQVVSMEKVVYVAQFCGKKIPKGTKCGSYVVPTAWRGR